MKKLLATLGVVAVIVLAPQSKTHAATDPFHYSNWSTYVWPALSGAYVYAFTWGAQTGAQESNAYWVKVGTNFELTWPSDTSAWFRVRARCYQSEISTATEHRGSGSSVLVTGLWTPPNATGPNNGPPEAWVKCPTDKKFAFEAQGQVASLYTTGFFYGN